ncbi:hypothetical protein SpCBS45565_g07990 [Spizellomyces sp. 'palustris']|nr:hypothetical protein SpCBS45565_g07990 [Spizellomyces sp. 'palustris']
MATLPHPHALTAKTPRKPSLRPTSADLSPAHSVPVVHDPAELLHSVNSVVKNRNGSVLCRQAILKSDHFDTGLNPRLDFHLQGAPNFRSADLNIFGVAQPTIPGIRTILTLLGCGPTSKGRSQLRWFSSREEPIIYLNRKPFVIRDIEHPLTNIRFVQGISASRLEQMESRLKEDIEKEAARFGGLLLVHDELEPGRVVPTWMAIDHIQTSREVFESFVTSGFRIRYFRIPVSPEQAPEDRYIDEYVQAIKDTVKEDALIFNCGMGVGRTTFAMVLAILIRRAQLIASREEDPIPVTQNLGSQANLLGLEEATAQNKAMLRMMYVLEKGLSAKQHPGSALDWVLARGPLIADLKNAILGNYQCISQLASVISHGPHNKKLLDVVIDRCDIMINLREVTLMHRVEYFVDGDPTSLQKAIGCLERYFFLLAFCSYIDEHSLKGYQPSFTEWLKMRPEISVMLENFRVHGPRLHLFRPIEDLSLLSTDMEAQKGRGWDKTRPTAYELEKHVIKSRKGTVLAAHTILKVDHWMKEAQDTIEGAANFRKLPGLNVYGVAQPTIQGVKNVMHVLEEDSPSTRKIIWINLREEPLIYINGIPYVLRDEYVTLRNIKSYSGITSNRLELMEARLKMDTLSELETYENQILLHNETPNGDVVAQWEDCHPSNVLTLKEVFELVKVEGKEDYRDRDIEFAYWRVPVTAETPPGTTDFDDLRRIICEVDPENTALVVSEKASSITPGTAKLEWGDQQLEQPEIPTPLKPPLNYAIIHSLLRVIRNGLECKRVVDEFIDACGQQYNLRDAIEEFRLKAEHAPDEQTKANAIAKGVLNLKRYFLLIAFQAYLNQNEPGFGVELESFTLWLDSHAEFKGMKHAMELENGMDAILPVEQMDPGDGLALSSEVLEVVSQRNGAVMGKNTILKYDMFPGAQKLSLTERIDGAPNYRRIPLPNVRGICMQGKAICADTDRASAVYGIGMPTKTAIRTVLHKVGASPHGVRQLVWTSLREEPVLYINGRPYVLRLFQDPMKNLEATGITHERVEMMEYQMKLDAIAEIKKYGGRMLLHEEEADSQGFSIVPVWETVKGEDVQTPLEVYRSIQEEGYRVDYLRLPITDEQAPIPDVFDRLVERLTRVTESTDIMFNCQMGRGRTTTGMIITCLMEMIVGNSTLISNPGQIYETEDIPLTSVESDVIRQRYQNGEYKMILQLVAVLSYGKLAKRLTDIAIDTCEHIQNLRGAIYDYKLRIEALGEKSAKRQSLFEVGCNYLVRYFYLIVFADYLLEIWAGWEGRLQGVDLAGEVEKVEREGYSAITGVAHIAEKASKLIDFSAWLAERREIANLARKELQGLE